MTRRFRCISRFPLYIQKSRAVYCIALTFPGDVGLLTGGITKGAVATHRPERSSFPRASGVHGDAFLQINLDTIYELSSHSAGEGVGTLTFTVLSQVGS